MMDVDMYYRWLIKLADEGGKGVVNNIDARGLGNAATCLRQLQEKIAKLEQEDHMVDVQELKKTALTCEEAGIGITLLVPSKKPKGWPRGHLLCINAKKQAVYTYDPLKILLWCRKNSPDVPDHNQGD